MPGNPFTDPNWAADIADTIERVVGTVRDRTTKPLVTASRGLSCSDCSAAILGVVALTLADHRRHPRHCRRCSTSGSATTVSVYLSYLIVGGIFCLGGLFVLSKRFSND